MQAGSGATTTIAPDRPFGRAALVIGSTVFIGLVVGLAEAGVLGVRHALGQFIWSSHHFGWMAPVSWVGLLLVVAVPLAVVAWITPRLPVAAVAVTVAVTIAGFGFVRLASAQRLHPVAIGVLAIGLGLQLGQMVWRRPERWARIVWWGTPILGGLVAVFGVGSLVAERLGERNAIAGLPAAIPGAPNVLLLVLDTVRGDNLSLYGYPRPTTPAIDSLARTGVTFDWAFSTAPWTLPSHASMFTGQWPWKLSAKFLHSLDDEYPTIAERFRANGYVTGGFTANHIYATYETGLDRGFIHYSDYLVSPRQIALSSELGQLVSSKRSGLAIRSVHRSYAPMVNREVLDWIPPKGGRPFFVFANYMDVHLPYGTPKAWNDRFEAGKPKVDRYDAALGYLDQQLGQLFDSLRVRGALDNTIVIITSDHGEHLGDHGMDDHANSLYSQLLRVPLVVIGPTAPAGKRVNAAVSLVDLAPTMLDLAGLPADQGHAGRSLARFWQGDEQAGADSVLYAQVDRHPLEKSWFRNRLGELWAAIDPEYHLIVNPDSSEELFRYREDRGEEHDLRSSPDAAAGLERLQALLEAARRKH